MAKQSKQTEETIVDVEKVYSKTETFFNENKNIISYIAIAVIVIVGGYFSFNNFYLNPLEKEASELIWKAEYYFETGDIDKAIDGDGNHFGFAYVADEYSITKSGKLAKYYLGMCYMKKQDYVTAISYLKDCNLEDEIVSSVALGTIGDAYIELDQVSEAINYFDRAANNSDNAFSAPIYLKKKGIALESIGDYTAAMEAYQTIKEKYPNSNEGREIAKYIARAESYIQ